MKKLLKVFFIFFIGILVIYGISKDISKVKKSNEFFTDNNSVDYNGWLRVDGSKLLNSNDEVIQLRGVSSHGIQWYKNIYTYNNLKNLKEEWGINTFRIAMYTSPKEDGYIANPYLREDVIKIINDAINLDMYVIVDWHILLDSDPNEYIYESMEFFDYISNRYRDIPNVIYEICNEPGKDVYWEKDIKPYSEKVIDVIRKNSPKSLILVGIPEWSKDLDSVSHNLLNFDNIMYTVHFYSGTDGNVLKNKIKNFIDKNLAIFISECGITDATGDGKIYESSFKDWIDFLNDNNISWIFWSFSNKDESSSILDSNYKVYMDDSSDIENDFNDYLTETGEIIKDIFRDYEKTTELQ